MISAHRVNAELVNNLANFCHRTLSLVRSRFEGRVGPPSQDPDAMAAWKAMTAPVEGALQGYRDLEFRQAVAQIVAIGDQGNLFLQRRKPWELGPTAHGDLSLCARAAFAVGLLLKPIVPRIADAVLAQLSRENATFADLTKGNFEVGPELRPGPASLMARIEAQQAAQLAPEESKAPSPATPTSPKAVESAPKPPVNLDAFLALDLRCGLILKANPAGRGAK